MPSRESKASDSGIWMNPVSRDDFLKHLVIPSNMAEIVKQARELSESKLKKRIKSFRVRATHQILEKPLY